MRRRFDGRCVLVTGGASGIGLAAARAFAQEGASVVLADLDFGRAGDAVVELLAEGLTAAPVAVDVADYASVQAMVAFAEDRFGRVHVAFNNAGVPTPILDSFEATDIAEWHRVVAVNLTGIYYCMKAQAPALRRAGGTAIINTASIEGIVGNGGMPSYVASKHGVLGLTKSAALDLIREGIRVNAVCPGFVDTPMLAPALADAGEAAHIAAMAPIGRVAAPAEIAAAVLFLASDEASYIVGQQLVVDGGVTIR